jgi:SSS family transporter
MRPLDWAVVAVTLSAIVLYGLWKSRAVHDADTYLRGGKGIKWWTVGLSIMATQASATTFLSTPGQAYQDGMGFVQFYIGLPIAMVLLAAVIAPIYFKLKVYTAYEYLETRFDRKTRQLVALLFLISRSLAAGLSIYAPAIVLSTVFGWSLWGTTVVIGLAVIVYTVSGGTRVVNQTQTQQMIVALFGMAIAFGYILHRIPISFSHSLDVAGSLGRMKIVDFSPNLTARYTFWSGMTGGLIVQLAYFGTDQSQVQRYLSGGSLVESRLGLLFNGLVKIPMQFGILLCGLMVFVFYQFNQPPVFFNQAALAEVQNGPHAAELATLEREHVAAFADSRRALDDFVATHSDAAQKRLRAAFDKDGDIRERTRALVATRAKKDADYIFIRFITTELPVGLVGLLVAVIFCAAMSATAAALNSLGTSTVVDFYKPSLRPNANDAETLAAARAFTVGWGVVAVAFAAGFRLFDNLIQAVNILGSLFYGPMLGVFLVGFFVKRVRGTPAFVGVLVAQAAVLGTAFATEVPYLYYNVIGFVGTVLVSFLIDLAL